MTIANSAYGSGAYSDKIAWGIGLLRTNAAEILTTLKYGAPTIIVHSRIRMAALDGRQRHFDGGHEMQTLFC